METRGLDGLRPALRALVLALLLTGCDQEEDAPKTSRFLGRRIDYAHTLVIDRVTGCQFLYIDAYKMSGLAAIPGTCRFERAKPADPREAEPSPVSSDLPHPHPEGQP